MRRSLIFASLLALALAGCSGSALTPTPAVPSAPDVGAGGRSLSADGASGARPTAVRASVVAACGDCTASFNAVDGIGGAVGALGVENAAENPPKHPQAGVCTNGTKIFSPDRAGDPYSSEVLYFYDTSCVHLSRDTVRRFNHGTQCDTVTVTVTNWALDGTWLSRRVATVKIRGSVREAQSSFKIGQRTIDNSIELIVMPSSTNVAAFCGDWAGYNATGVAHNGTTTFGWAGGFVSGTRTVNGNKVTWSGKRDSTFYAGHLGHLKIVQGNYNTACPVSTPAYTIGGGTAVGSSTGTTTVSFVNGLLECLFVSRTHLGGGYYVMAESHSNVSPHSPNFITGTVSHNGHTVSTFSLNDVGNGTLYVEATHCRFYVAGWTVVRG